MALTIKSAAVYDALIALLDTIAQEQDALQRLDLFQYLATQYEKRVIPARDRAAYEARLQHAVSDICERVPVDRRSVYYWSERHMHNAGAAPMKRRERQDVSSAIDISDRVLRGGTAEGHPAE
jgi:hypothetical protein